MRENSKLDQDFTVAARRNAVRVLDDCVSDHALLDKAFATLMPGNFPPAEAAEAAYLTTKLYEGSPFRFLVLGENLGDPVGAVIKGLSVGLFFPDSETAALWYLVTDPKQRRQGIGGTLVFETAAELQSYAATLGKNIHGYFAHIHDPALPAAADDPFDAAERVTFYHRLGAQRVRLSHFFSPDNPPCEPYLLIAIPQKPGEAPDISKRDVRAHAADYYREYAVQEPEQHPDFQRMMAELDSLGEAPLLGSLAQDMPQALAPFTPGATSAPAPYPQ